VPETVKLKDTKQSKKTKDKLAITELPVETDSDPKEPTVEDISELQPSKSQSSIPSPSKENITSSPRNNIKTDLVQNNTHDEEKVTENSAEKDKFAAHNTRTQVEKPFNLEIEIGKLKIAIPLSKLARHEVYREKINRSLQIPENRDAVNVLDDQPELLFGPEVNGKTRNGGVPPFYVSLKIHDKVLHNAMFDSDASHNLMPKSVMERLDLDITRPYKDLFSFDSSQVRCLGLIKDLCVSLVQYPTKTILMDVVVADIPPKYGMLLSRSWGAKLQGSLQLDMSYATISISRQPKRLYQETLMKYVVSSEEKPQNFLIYSIHSDMDSFILYNADMCPKTDVKLLEIAQTKSINEQSTAQDQKNVVITDITNENDSSYGLQNPNLPTEPVSKAPNTSHNQEILWYLEFDGSVNKLGAGVGVWIYNMQNDHAEGHAYRQNFRCTNNMAEYEALLLGLKLIKNLGATKISILGDSNLIIQQMKGNFVTNDLRLRAYRAATIEILNTFSDNQLTKISRKYNLHAHSLATFASTCKLPFKPNHHFTAEIKHRPAIPDNVKNWHVFQNDTQINNFLTLKEEFSNINIDTSIVDDQQQVDKSEQSISVEKANLILHPTTFDCKIYKELKQINLDEMVEGESEVIEIKDNFLPAGLTPLEDKFDSNDIPRKPKMQPLNAKIEDCNIGTTENPKIIKLSKGEVVSQG